MGTAAVGGGGERGGVAAGAMAAQAIMQSIPTRPPLSPSGIGWPAQWNAIAEDMSFGIALASAMPIRPNGAMASAITISKGKRRRKLTAFQIGQPPRAGNWRPKRLMLV